MERKFKPFDRVLVRESDDSTWCTAIYSHFDSSRNRHVMICKASFLQCILYEGNEHLVGTDTSPDESEKFEFGEHVEVRVNDVDTWGKAIYLWPSRKAKGFHVCVTEKEYNGWTQCRKADW